MRGLSDEQLMRQYAAGDMSAFETLYERYRGPLYRYIQRQVREPATVNDLYQGSWEKLIKARRQFKPSASFRAWLFRIAHNHLVDHYRSRKQTEALDPEQMPANNPQPAEVTEGEEQESK